MCQMYRKECACGEQTSEIFFGNHVLDQHAIIEVYCPKCSEQVDAEEKAVVMDNGWAIELDMAIVGSQASRMELDPDTITADEVFDGDYITWVGFTPDDNLRRTQEVKVLREKLAHDARAHFEAMKKWAADREKRFHEEGWRKARRNAA